MSYKPFFKEWKDGLDGLALTTFFTVTMFLVVMWIVTNIPSEANRAMIYALLLIGGAVVGDLDYILESLTGNTGGYDNVMANYAGYGKNLRVFRNALLIGGALGLLLNFSNILQYFLPLSIALEASIFTFFYIVFAAPYIEEKAFRSWFPFQLSGALKGLNVPFYDLIGFAIAIIGFGVFHFLAYNGSIVSMIAAIIFATIAVIGNNFCKSSGFGIGLHWVHNFIIYVMLYGFFGLI